MDKAGSGIMAARRARRRRRAVRLLRLLLVGLSVVGVVAACLLWAAGRGGLAARLLAGDVVVLFWVLMAVAWGG